MDTERYIKLRPLKVLPGLNGCLELFTDRVVYQPSGFLAKLTRWPEREIVEIALDKLGGVEFHEGVFLTNGYLKLTGEENVSIILVFERNQHEVASELRNLLLEYMGRRFVTDFHQTLTPE